MPMQRALQAIQLNGMRRKLPLDSLQYSPMNTICNSVENLYLLTNIYKNLYFPANAVNR
jgi:hypothetical protein